MNRRKRKCSWALSNGADQNLLSCLFLLTILLGKIHGDMIARTNKKITTKKGHQDATSMIIFDFGRVKIGAFTLFIAQRVKKCLACLP
jgi:hypothetical protein